MLKEKLKLILKQTQQQLMESQLRTDEMIDIQKKVEELQKSLQKIQNSGLLVKQNSDLQIYHQFKLELGSTFPKLIFKNRQFSFTILLKDNNDQLVLEKIPIQLKIYDCTQKNQILQNMNGQKIIRGQENNMLIDGRAQYNKIKISEVSSHFPQSNFTFIVTSDDQRCKPLVISPVKVFSRFTK